ncbi:MAG: hypothetical protein BalsKO_14080 [Balneolaceae bacterium]
MKTVILTSVLLIAVFVNVFAQSTSEQAKVEVLSKSTTSWDGTALPNYPDGEPEITISKITLPTGFQLPVHKHPIPLGGYILSGELTVTREDGKIHTAKAGETLIELVDTWHFGKNEGDEPVVLIAFYIGIKDQPLSIPKEN